MNRYDFFAIERYPNGNVFSRTRWQLEADTFEEACHHAQCAERYDAEIEDGYEAVIYDDYELLAVTPVG